jgi:Xaa-Pro aminopeptidase
VPEAVRGTLAADGVVLRRYEDVEKTLAGWAARETVLADTGALTDALYSVLAGNPAFAVREGADPILLLKAVKNETELACTRQAHLADGAAMVRFQMELERRLAAGETLRETDIDPILHRFRSANEGFWGESFGTIAAYGPNAAMMHYAPKPGADAEIARRGFLLVDSGATYRTGTTDITRTYAVGPLTEAQKTDYTLVLQCHIALAMAVWKAGANGGELDMLARQPLWSRLLDYRSGTGHSVAHVGAVHEGPHSLRPHNAVEFVPGMVITDEPGLYEEGDVGIRVENELECVEAGESEYGRFLRFAPLTWVPIDLTPVLPALLTQPQRDWLNAYHAGVLARLSPLLNAEETAWLAGKCAPLR